MGNKLYYLFDEVSQTTIGAGTLDECMFFVQDAAFHGNTGYCVIDAETGEVVS